MFAPNYKDVEKCGLDLDDSKVPDYCQVLRFKDANGQVKEMVFPKALDLDRPKRPRTTFSDSQLAILEKEFVKNPYLVGKERTRLAANLDLTETQIKVWFQNRRTKSKKDKTGGEVEKEKNTEFDSGSLTSSSTSPNSPNLSPSKSFSSFYQSKHSPSFDDCKNNVNHFLPQLPSQMTNPLMYSSNFGNLPYMYPMFPVTQVLRR